MASQLFLALALALADVAQPDHAPAEVSDDSQDAIKRQAMAHHDAGIDFYQRGLLPQARIEFEAGYKLNGKPEWLFNLAKTAQRQGELADARRYALQYQAAVSLPDEKKDAAELLASLPAESAATPDPKPAAASPKVNVGAWVLLGIGGGCLVGAIGTGAAASSLSARVESGPLVLSDYQAAQSLGEGLNRGSIALLSIGLAFGVAGGTWAIVNRYGRQHRTP